MPTSIGNFFVKALVNSPLYPLLGSGFAVITVTGCKTGRNFSTPVNLIRLDGTLTIISLRNRTWWRNLRGGCLASLRHLGKQIPVRGETIESQEEIALFLVDYFRQNPTYAKYFKIRLGPDGILQTFDLESLATERVLVRLTPV